MSRGAWQAAVVAAVAVAVQLPVYDRWLSLMDEGHLLQYAAVIADGGEMYRDAPVYPLPGAFYLLALAFRLAGPSMLVARAIVVVEFAVLCAAAFLLLRRIVSGWAAAAGVALLFLYRLWAFPHWQMYSYSSTALCLLAVALLCLVRALDAERAPLLALAGLVAGLGVLCKQDYGAAGVVALNVTLGVVALARGARRALPTRLAWLNAPILGLALITAAHFWRQGLLGEMVRLTFLTHLRTLGDLAYPALPPLSPLFGQTPALRGGPSLVVYTPPILATVDWEALQASWVYARTALWDVALKLFFYGPYPLLAAGAVRLWRRRVRLRDPADRAFAAETALWVFAALLTLSLNRPRDFLHVAVLYWPLLLLLVVYASALARRSRAAAVAVGVVAAVAAVPSVAYSARLAARLRALHPAPVEGPRGGVRVKAAEAAMLAETVRWIRAHATPAAPVAVFPYFPLISFLAERRAPHPSAYVVWPVPDRPDRDARVVDALEATGAPVVYGLTQWPQFPPFPEYAPAIFAHLVDRYAVDRIVTPDPWGYVLACLLPRTQPEPGAPIPLDAAVAVVDDGGAAGAGAPAGGGLFALARWPFRPVVALRPRAGGGRTVLRVPLAVPAGGGRLRTAVAVDPAQWVGYPASRVTFELAVNGEPAFTATLDPRRLVADRRWVEADVPLGRWAGGTVELALAASAERAEAEDALLAGWAHPRLVAP